jgi:ATP-dependent helicase/nuclease subunit B
MAAAVGQAIRYLQAGNPLRLVRVIAPDSATVDGLRRALPLNGGSCGAEIGGTLRLANQISAPELNGRRVAPDVAVLAVVQQVLADPATRPAAFATCADHPATHDAIVRAYASLAGAFTLSDDPVAALASLAVGRASASAVCEVITTVRKRLLASGLIDSAEIIRIATRRLNDSSLTAAELDLAPLVVVVTQQFNPAHVAMLQALVTLSPGVAVVATTTRRPELSAAAHVARLLDVDEAELSAPTLPATERSVKVVSCPDHDEEVREVTRRIVGLLERGVVADRIAVFYPPAGPHRSAIAASLAAAGVAARGQVTPQLKGAVAGQILRLMMTIITDGLDRRTLVELARLAPFGRDVDQHGQVRTFARRADRWNRLAQRHGVVGERDWSAFEAALPDEDDVNYAAHRSLLGFVRLQRHHRDAVRAARSWHEVALALEAWFITHCGDVEWRLDTWVGYPAWQREAAEQVEGVFPVLSDIEQFGLQLRPLTLSRLITAFLDTDAVTTESKGAGVFVDQIVGATGAVFDHAFVVGANEHLLPGRVADDLVLTRAHGAEPLGVLTGPANRPRRDERGLLAAIDGATAEITVTWARWDIRSGGEQYPTPLLTAGAALALEIIDDHVASHAAQLRSTDTEWIDADEWFTRDLERTTPRLARRRRAITARSQLVPGEFDGQVGELGASSPLVPRDGGAPEVGITSFEDWIKCGLKYFVTRVLGARTDETDPSEITDIEPREKGTLIHEVFERVILDWLAEHPDADQPWVTGADDVAALAARAETVLDELAAPLLAAHHLGHPEMWRARRAQILNAIGRGLHDELSDPVTPVAAEFSFGHRSGGLRPAAVWVSPDTSTSVAFSGSIDRVDRAGDGSLRVMDLKSGVDTDFRKIDELSPLGPDRDKLQLAFYGWAVDQLTQQPVTSAAYRFVGRPERAPDVTLALTDDVFEQLHARIHEVVTAINEGRFQPGEVGQWGCEVCAPDGLGASEANQRRTEWEGDDADDEASFSQAIGDLP